MQETLDELIAWAKTQPEIMALYFYGSHMQGYANPLSDIDIAIMVRPEIPKTQLWRLEDRWAVIWPEWVDLRILNLAPLPFRYEVTAHGRRLWTAAAVAVADVESLIWRQYWDIRPRLKQDLVHFVEQILEQKDEAERQQYAAALVKVRAVHHRVRETTNPYSGEFQD